MISQILLFRGQEKKCYSPSQNPLGCILPELYPFNRGCNISIKPIAAFMHAHTLMTNKLGGGGSMCCSSSLWFWTINLVTVDYVSVPSCQLLLVSVTITVSWSLLSLESFHILAQWLSDCHPFHPHTYMAYCISKQTHFSLWQQMKAMSQDQGILASRDHKACRLTFWITSRLMNRCPSISSDHSLGELHPHITN